MENTTDSSTTNVLSSHSFAATTVSSYIRNVSTMNQSTAYQYHSRLKDFEDFIGNEYHIRLSVDSLLKIKHGNLDPFDVLNGYAAYLKNSNVSTLTLKQRIVTVKNFFEYCEIDRSPRRLKLKVKLPKIVRKKKPYLKKRLLKY